MVNTLILDLEGSSGTVREVEEDEAEAFDGRFRESEEESVRAGEGSPVSLRANASLTLCGEGTPSSVFQSALSCGGSRESVTSLGSLDEDSAGCVFDLWWNFKNLNLLESVDLRFSSIDW